MSGFADLSEKLRRRLEREEKQHEQWRRIYGYRRPNGDLADNVLVQPYMDLAANLAYLKGVFSPVQMDAFMCDYEVVYLGVWRKDKRRMDLLDAPVVQFRLGDVCKTKDDKHE